MWPLFPIREVNRAFVSRVRDIPEQQREEREKEESLKRGRVWMTTIPRMHCESASLHKLTTVQQINWTNLQSMKLTNSKGV